MNNEEKILSVLEQMQANLEQVLANITGLREGQAKLEDVQAKLWENMIVLKKGQDRLRDRLMDGKDKLRDDTTVNRHNLSNILVEHGAMLRAINEAQVGNKVASNQNELRIDRLEKEVDILEAKVRGDCDERCILQ